jgi:protein-S-isoprenylcysteine O-methyltransferase Ste14
VILTLVAAYLGKQKLFSAGIFPTMKIPLIIVGISLIVIGVILGSQAITASRIRRQDTVDKLITTGTYAWVRNSLYAGYSFIFSGILCFENNLFLFITPFIFWLSLSLIVRKEESMLEKTFGYEYIQYKSRVNRCIPWLPKKP